MIRKLALTVICLQLFWTAFTPQAQAFSYLHAQGTTNIDIYGYPILLRGVNLGSWLWPEYYMMGDPDMSSFRNAGTGSGNINNYYDGLVAALTDLLGNDTNLVAKALDAYWTNYVSAADIQYLHTCKFNSVRVPFDFEEFFCVTNWANNYPSNGYDLDVGFKYFDNLIAWGSSNGIYVFPDFHCPPGGPNNLDVVNYGGTVNTNTASVFTSTPNLALCAHIWQRIAARYATNQWIGGYDLLNEPVATTASSKQVGSPILANTFSNLVYAIRAVDTNHMLLCEGDTYASTLYDVLNTGWSDPYNNLSLSDHDYGSTLPLGTGNRSTAVQYNVPDWAGEFGINSTRWYNRIANLTYGQRVTLTAGGHTSTITEGNCFWAYKSCQYYTVVQNPQTAGWNRFKAYWASGLSASLKPSTNDAYNWFIQYCQAANFSNCVAHPEIVDSLIRANTNAQFTGFAQLELPYKSGIQIPGRIFAVDYDMGDTNFAYVDTVSQDEANQGPGGTAWNNGYFGRDEGVDTTSCNDPGTLLKVGWNDAGEWQRHTLTCTPGTYNVYVRYGGGADGGQIDLSLLTFYLGMVNASNHIAGPITLPSTGGYTNYATLVVTNVVVTNTSTAALQITVVNPGADLVWVEFAPASGAPLPPSGEINPGAQVGVPIGLTRGVAVDSGNSAVALHWVAANNATSYRVRRAFASGGPYSVIATGLTNLSFIDTGVTNGSTYYYTVSAVNAVGAGPDSLEVNCTPQSSSLPVGWLDDDIGLAALWTGDSADVGFAGSASLSGSTYTVSGSGVDIWNNSDSFHYVYHAVSGDFTNTVRVVLVQNSDSYAKAGIMVRDSLNGESAQVSTVMTSRNGAQVVVRPATGAASTSTSMTGLSAPYYLRLVRQGNVFTGSASANGSTWTQINSVSVPIAASAFIGLAVCAHNNLYTNTSVFDSFSLTLPVPAPPTGVKVVLTNAEPFVSWNSSTNATGYNVKRAVLGDSGYTTIANNVSGTNYTDATALAGTTYYYVVSAVSGNGESLNSNPVSITPVLPIITTTISNGTKLQLSWTATAPSFALYAATNLVAPVMWWPITNAVASQGTNLSTTLRISNSGNLFYRLQYSGN